MAKSPGLAVFHVEHVFQGGNVLIIARRIDPSPKFHPRTAFFVAIPWPRAPTFSIPSPSSEPEMKLFGMCVLYYLPQGSRKESEVLVVE